QAPKQPSSPPADEPEQKIKAGDHCQILQKAEKTTIEFKNAGQQSTGHHRRGHQIGPGEALPDFFEIGAEGFHRDFNGNTTLHESEQRMQAKRLTVGLRAESWINSAHGKKVLLLRRVTDATVVAAVSEINYQSDDQPNDEAGPVHPPELVHHVAVEQDSKHW